MKRKRRQGLWLVLLVLVCLFIYAQQQQEAASAPSALTLLPQTTDALPAAQPPATQPPENLPDEGGSYDSKDEVALYLHSYGRLPDNYMSKKEAEALGWSGGSLESYAPGRCIGGSRFGNYEGLLPEAEGRQYYECDIDTLGASARGAKRLVYSNDGLIYYTGDHYESFEQLYGGEA